MASTKINVRNLE